MKQTATQSLLRISATLTFMLLMAVSMTVTAQTDVTSSILNPSFDGRGLGGWRNTGFQTQTNTSFAGKTNYAYAEKWVTASSTLPDGYFLQNISGLTNGQYTLTVNAQCVNQNTNATGQTGAYLVGNENSTTIDANASYSVTFYVVDGTAEIGVKLQNCTGNWVAFDSFTLSRVSTTTAQLRTGLSTLVTKANTLASQNMNATVKSALNSAISTANNYTSSGSAANCTSAYTALKAAVKNAENSIYAYGKTEGTGVTVTTDTRYMVGTTMAFARATFSGSNIATTGFVYSTTNTTPTLEDNRTTYYMTNNGNIYVLDNLTPGSTYYIRPFALTTANRVSYGDVLRIYTHPRSTSLGYNFNASGDTDIDARLKGSMDAFIGYWNACTAITGYQPTANYASGTPTADCSYGGWIRFGSNVANQLCGTALHELMHGIGVGTDIAYQQHMEVPNSGPGSSYGQWLGKRATKLTHFYDNNETEWITGGGAHVWATASPFDYTINGADKDKFTDLQYYCAALLAQAMCEDGMCPVANKSFMPCYSFTHTDNTKYYIRNSNSSYGLNTSTYLYATGTTLKWKTYDSDVAAKADNAAAWYIEFDPATQYYYFKNVSTGRYLNYNSSAFDVSGSAKNSNTQIHLHQGWWDATFGSGTAQVTEDVFYLMHPAETAHPVSLKAAASGNLTTEAYWPYEDRSALRWMILAADDMDEVENAVVATERNNVLDIIEKVRTMSNTAHTDNTGTANSTLSSTLSTIESAVPTASSSQCETYYNQVIDACKTFMQNTTPGTAGYDITFLVTNPGMDGTAGWSGTAPGNNYSASEFFQTTFDYYQILNSMPSGDYRLKIQAYERPGAAADVYTAYKSGTDAVTTVAYVGSASATVNNISAFAVSTKRNVGEESEVSYNDVTAYFPNNMQAGANYFAANYYDNTVDLTGFAGGDLRFGIRNTTSVTADWTMFDNVRLIYVGSAAGDETSVLEDWTKLDILPADYSLYFFSIFDHSADLGMVQKTGVHQGSGNTAMWYQADVNPGEDKTALWTFDAYTQDNTEYVVLANATNPNYMMQTEWNAAWHFRTSDNGGGNATWGRTLISYADSKWTIQNGYYPGSGYLGPWDNVITDGAETALNKTGDAIGYFDIYSMLRGTYVSKYEQLGDATSSNPIDITYVLENPGGERRSSIGWKTDGAGWQSQVSNALTGKVGSYFLESYNGSGLAATDLYQEIQGLPDGRYNFSAIAHCSSNCILYANDTEIEIPTNNPGTRTNVIVTLSGGVNTLRVGFKTGTNPGNWIAVDDAHLEYLGELSTYEVGTASVSLTDDSYIQNLTTVTYTYTYASASDASAVFDILDSSAKATLKKGSTTVAQGTLSLSGNTVTATFSGLTLDPGSDYTLTLPADAVGYAGHATNEAVTLTLHTPALFDTTCYLYNDTEYKYLSRNGAWNTQAVADDYGLAVQIVTNEQGKTHLRMFDNQLYVFNDGNGTLFADGGTPLDFTAVAASGKYRFQCANGYLAVSNGTVVDNAAADATSLWTLETTADHVANYTTQVNAQAATAATAASLSGVTTAAQLAGMIGTDFVTESITITGAQAEKYQQYAPTVADGTDLDYYTETIEDVRPGLYRLTVDAFQRASYNERVADADGARGLIMLFANDAQTQLKSVMEYGAATAYAGDYEYNGLHYPNNEASAYTALETGNYKNTIYVYVPADDGETTGTLTFGIRILNRMGNNVNTGTWSAYKNFQLDYLMPVITLSELSTTQPQAAANVLVNLTRSISAASSIESENAWNTICLPFALTADQVEAFGEDVVVKKLTGVDTTNGNATLSFTELASGEGIEANVPYILKTTTAGTSYTFRDVTIAPSATPVTEIGSVQFTGNYVAEHVLTTDDYYILGDKFYKSSGKTKMKGYRAYFHIPSSSGIKSLGFDFGDPTAIVSLGTDALTQPVDVYTPSGQLVRRQATSLDGLPRGVYIIGGKKVMK